MDNLLARTSRCSRSISGAIGAFRATSFLIAERLLTSLRGTVSRRHRSKVFPRHSRLAYVSCVSVVKHDLYMDLICGAYRNNMSTERAAILGAVHQGLFSEADIDRALRGLFTARFRLGLFDPPVSVPYSRVNPTENDSEAHRHWPFARRERPSSF
jgi:hypothetical protein